MKSIVFLAPYPTTENIKEGMMQRVAAIDAMFSEAEYKKIYIVPSFKTFGNSKQEIKDNVVCYHLSMWTEVKKMVSLINNAAIVYCHSLYGISIVGLWFWKKIKTTNVIWDVHGIIPEELKFAGMNGFKVKMFAKLERLIIYNVPKIVVVTNAMKYHLEAKYPNCKAAFYTYSILPITIKKEVEIKEKDDEEIVILYSGNVQKYQNIPLMAQSIAKIIDNDKLRFEILTGSPSEMRKIFKQYGLDRKSNIHINSVCPSELNAYYKRAHYGYVLRDDIDVNNVACPTKIVEYLAYGLTAIVLCPNIGDFAEMGYEYIEVDKLATKQLYPSKSNKNIEIYNQLVEQGDIAKFKAFIEK